jgi:porphobilinogen deaminase
VTDVRTRHLLSGLEDPAVRTCVELERNVVIAMGGDCESPIAALANVADGRISLQAAIGARGGRLPVIRAAASSVAKSPDEALNAVLCRLAFLDAPQLLLTGAANVPPHVRRTLHLPTREDHRYARATG